MALSAPAYLQAANIQDATIRFLWDDWNVEQAEEPINEDLMARLGGISQRAVVAFTNSTAEWIIHRFRKMADVTEPVQYLETAWAQIVEWRYGARTWEEHAPRGEWAGPVRGPLGIAMTRVMYAVQQAKDNETPELRAAWITNLAPYVMADPIPYQTWREQVMERLEKLYPRDPGETLGEVVPREALDPGFEFQIEQTETLVNKFLASLDYKANPFLRSPAEMLAAGFKGTPYVFDIEKERQERLVF